jgi:hypothetical protein
MSADALGGAAVLHNFASFCAAIVSGCRPAPKSVSTVITMMQHPVRRGSTLQSTVLAAIFFPFLFCLPTWQGRHSDAVFCVLREAMNE